MRPEPRSPGDDLAAHWMPFTDNRAFKAAPRLFAAAKDMHYVTPDGRKVLDGAAGLWCVNAGHTRERIVEAIRAQAGVLDYAPSFQLGHPKAFQLATRLAEMLPRPLDKVFFTGSGSEAVDTALKIALAYQRAIGQGGRTRLIGRERGYHGVGFGGISVGGIVGNRRAFGPLLPGVDHLRHTHRPGRFDRGQPADGADLADDLERLIGLHGAETIAAVIVEPLAGSTGVLVPPIGYLERLRRICDAHGVLLIFDEVITAFGRLGAACAAEALRVTPDLMTMAKGLTNGAVPMGAVGVRDHVHDAILAAAEPGIELFHGYTYSAHPLAVAAALASLDVYEDEGLFARAAGLSAYWEAAAHRLRGAPHVADIRNLGLVAGFDIAPRAGAPAGQRAMDVFRRCFADGLLIRPSGDTLALSPPLIVSEGQIDEIFDRLSDALRMTP